MLYWFECAGLFLGELADVIFGVEQWPWTAPFPPSVSQIVNERVFSLGCHIGIGPEIKIVIEYTGIFQFSVFGPGKCKKYGRNLPTNVVDHQYVCLKYVPSAATRADN